MPVLPTLLVARSDLGKHVEGRHRRLVILQHQHLEPVGQGLGLDVVGDTRRAGGAREPIEKRGNVKVNAKTSAGDGMVVHG